MVKEHLTSVGWPIACFVLGEVLKAALPYLEHAAGAIHSRLLSTSYTGPANKLSLCQLVM